MTREELLEEAKKLSEDDTIWLVKQIFESLNAMFKVVVSIPGKNYGA